MRALLACAILLAAASPAEATSPCLCPDTTGLPLFDEGVTGVPRNARFYGRTPQSALLTADGEVVATLFEPFPGRTDRGWVIPLAPLAAGETYRFEGQSFTTGAALDTAAPAVGSLVTRAGGPGGCGLNATAILEAVGYDDGDSALDLNGVVMKVSLRPATSTERRTVFLPARGAVLGAYADLDPCGNIPWEQHDAEFRASVTLIDMAGNESAPTPEIAFTLTLRDDDAGGCAVGAAPASPLALLLGVAALLLARRRAQRR